MRNSFNYFALASVFYGSLLIIVLYPKFVTIENKTVIEIIEPEKVETQEDLSNSVQQTLEWEDFKGKKYKLSYSYVPEYLNTKSIERASYQYFSATSKDALYNNVYKHYIENDKPFIDYLTKEFLKLAEKAKITSKLELAEMIVTAVQNQEYFLVHNDTCENVMKNGDKNSFGYKYHQEYSNKCVPNEQYYALACPSEFFFSKKGDCDTRTVALFQILKNIGVDVVIINSDSHSILGVANIGNYDDYFTKTPRIIKNIICGKQQIQVLK